MTFDFERSEINSVDDVQCAKLREYLELDPIGVVKHCIKFVREYGVDAFKENLLDRLTADLSMNIIGALGVAIGLGENFCGVRSRWLKGEQIGVDDMMRINLNMT